MPTRPSAAAAGWSVVVVAVGSLLLDDIVFVW